MGLFRALVGMAVETAKLPLAVTVDVLAAVPDACDPYSEGVGHRTKAALEAIKDEADKADKPSAGGGS